MSLAAVQSPKPQRAGNRLVYAQDAAQRAALQAFVAERYAAAYDAEVQHFLPQLYSLHDRDGERLAAFGLRAAAAAPLFLETYLDQPIERILALAAGQPVARAEIVEIGNLAGRHPGALRLLIPAVAELLMRSGFRWLAFTGSQRLVNGFARLGIPLMPLAPARPERLDADARAAWCRYYDDAPTVMGGNIPAGQRRLLERQVSSRSPA